MSVILGVLVSIWNLTLQEQPYLLQDYPDYLGIHHRADYQENLGNFKKGEG